MLHEKVCKILAIPGQLMLEQSMPRQFETIQYVAKYLDGTIIRTLETKTQFLRRHFSVLSKRSISNES